MRKKPAKIDFEEYINQGDPDKKERRNIEGEITIDEAQKLIEAHYQKK